MKRQGSQREANGAKDWALSPPESRSTLKSGMKISYNHFAELTDKGRILYVLQGD